MTEIVTTLNTGSTDLRADLLADCLRRLDPFRLSRQLQTIESLLHTGTTA
ncbi:hypothetical protein ACFQ0M_47890 [Kitasatospora aburaviensis]